MKNEFIAMKAVYSYFFPEVRELVKFGEKLPYELFFNTTKIKDAKRVMKGLLQNDLKLPSTKNGCVDLDSIHIPITKRFVKAYDKLIPHLKDFEYNYPLSGSSPGIFHLLSELKKENINEIYVLKGEYEGYREYAKTFNIKTIEVNEKKALEIKNKYFFISNPSARNGNIIKNEFIKNLCEHNNKIILDLAYVGMTEFYEFDVCHKNIIAVVMSLSKPYGVFRFRLGGFLFSRKSYESLYANKWFKDVPRLLTTLKLVEEIEPGSLYNKYKSIQKQIIREINREHNIELEEADVLLLANIDHKKINLKEKEAFKDFRRGENYRFCLTPYFEKFERDVWLL